MDTEKPKFYYKLCIENQKKIYCYMQRNIEFTIGQAITQDISQPSPYLYVFKTPEQAILNESSYTCKDNFSKPSLKTVIKLVCWGNSIETPRKSAFSNMRIVESLEISNENTIKKPLDLKNCKRASNGRREISPRGLKVQRENSPARIFASVIARNRSPIATSYIPKLRTANPSEIIQKMIEQTEKLDREAKNIEKWHLPDFND